MDQRGQQEKLRNILREENKDGIWKGKDMTPVYYCTSQSVVAQLCLNKKIVHF